MTEQIAWLEKKTTGPARQDQDRAAARPVVYTAVVFVGSFQCCHAADAGNRGLYEWLASTRKWCVRGARSTVARSTSKCVGAWSRQETITSIDSCTRRHTTATRLLHYVLPLPSGHRAARVKGHEPRVVENEPNKLTVGRAPRSMLTLNNVCTADIKVTTTILHGT